MIASIFLAFILATVAITSFIILGNAFRNPGSHFDYYIWTESAGVQGPFKFAQLQELDPQTLVYGSMQSSIWLPLQRYKKNGSTPFLTVLTGEGYSPLTKPLSQAFSREPMPPALPSQS